MFKPSKLRAYLLKARDAGYSPEEILVGSGTDWSDIEALRLLDLETIAGLFDFLARRTPADFAIRCGHASKVRDFGMVGFAMMSMPTLREAFDHWNRYCLVAGHPLITTIVEEGEHWCMHFVPRRPMSVEGQRFCMEASLAALERVIEELTGAPPRTVRVDCSFARPASMDAYAVFNTRNIGFGREITAYHGDRRDLDRLVPSWDKDIRDIFHRQCADFLAMLNHTRPITEQLEDLMQASAGNIPSLDEMAVSLGLSRRSLQRELEGEGMSYQSFVKQFRLRHAMTLLRENRSNTKTIAFMLGFKDVGSFRRAFQSWTGRSIGEWQASEGHPGGMAKRNRAAPQYQLAVN